MRKKITFLGFLIFAIIFSSFAQDADKLVSLAQFQRLNQLSNTIQKKLEASREKAFDLAAKNKWVIFSVQKDGTVISLQGLDDLGMPMYLKTYNNTTAAGTVKTNSLYSGGALGLNLNGSSANLVGKVGLWDGGSILKTHQEFVNNRIVQVDQPSNLSSHATHVAGTMMAAGVNPVARGMAWGLQKLNAYDFDFDVSEMATEASKGMLISNHSYGYIAGWNHDDDLDRWEWYGLANATEDYKFGFYDSSAKDWDVICYNAPYFLPVKSAGNSRNENGPEIGQPYYGYKGSSTSLTLIGNRPAGISNNDGYDIISTTGNAKNILTVGAINALSYGANQPSDVEISAFSSWGPTDDGRIKPDIVADGVSVTSTNSDSPKAYSKKSGTSMASPSVSGSLTLLQEYYSQLNSGNFMRSATLKALAIETADEAGTTLGPDYIYGWGLLNIEKAAALIKLNGNKSLIAERTLAQGEVYNLDVLTSGYGPLKVTICWTDPEATPAASGVLNNRTPKLVNDLDLRLTTLTETVLPFTLNPDLPASAATQEDNFRDNVEQVYIPNPTPGIVYKIKVSHKGNLVKGPQKYSIVASGIGGNVYCASNATSTADSRIESFQLSNINNILPNTCRSYSDFTSSSASLELGKTYPFNINLGSCGSDKDKIAKIFIDWNGDGDFNDTREDVATSGIINGNGLFSGNLTVPIDVIPDNYSILRVIVSETNEASSVTPCGTYSNGETQDYKVIFQKSSTDAGIVAINSLVNQSICETDDFKFTVTIKNYGGSPITNVPVTVSLINNNTVVKTITKVYNGTIQPNYEKSFTLNAVFSLTAGITYAAEAKTNLAGDVMTENNSRVGEFTVSLSPTIANLSAIECNNASGFYGLSGEGDGTIFWYDKANSIFPVAYGNQTSTEVKPSENIFYAGLNDFKAHIGPVKKQEYGGGTYSGNFGPKPEFTVGAPMVLDSAVLYTSQAGQLAFSVQTLGGVVLSTVVIDVDRSKTTPDVLDANEQIINDPNDNGKAYKIGLEFPAAGTYRIGIEYLDSIATIFRNNAGVTNVPFNISDDLIKMNGAYFVDNSGPRNITTSYYYFYNMLFKSLGCKLNERVSVPIQQLSKPTIQILGNSFISSSDLYNQWYFNGELIPRANQKTFNPRFSGVYRVDIVYPTGCIVSSENLSFDSPLENDNIEVKVYPVPANEFVNIDFEVYNNADLSISLINIQGKEVYKFKKSDFVGTYGDQLKTSDLNVGVYMLNISIGAKKYSRKISISR